MCSSTSFLDVLYRANCARPVVVTTVSQVSPLDNFIVAQPFDVHIHKQKLSKTLAKKQKYWKVNYKKDPVFKIFDDFSHFRSFFKNGTKPSCKALSCSHSFDQRSSLALLGIIAEPHVPKWVVLMLKWWHWKTLQPSIEVDFILHVLTSRIETDCNLITFEAIISIF